VWYQRAMTRPMSSSLAKAVAAGILVGSLSTATVLYAQKKDTGPPSAPAPVAPGQVADLVTAPFEIVDTPGSTYLLNRTTGQVWRLSFTEVKGNKYWYGMHVPVQQPGSFEEFQARLRKDLAGPE
jgi:hypothetical protein